MATWTTEAASSIQNVKVLLAGLDCPGYMRNPMRRVERLLLSGVIVPVFGDLKVRTSYCFLT